MKISEARLRELQSRGAIVKRAPRPEAINPVPEPELVDFQAVRTANAAELQQLMLSEIASALRDQNEYRSQRVRLKVNRKNGLIDSVDIERL